ncbi:glycosyltransferase [Lactobacillus gallinarum]|uniref:glycosyltransferase n=1 Tax=Lactobacillus gallinarum TaxID=52242 RepID=UPI0025A41452|nr:glycosyltransferase [Lactobacillus gallinarum]MDM8276949.1 glycosyltransferase [Lactobacillus gallinarum]
MKENVEYPSFSVLMSVYEKENAAYFSAALNSIEAQTVPPTEIILVEDGPLGIDLSRIIKKYKEIWGSRLKVIKISKNGGLGSALKLGTKYVTTNWIARMDTDDICVPDRFEIQLKEINRHPDYAIIGGQIDEFVNETNNIVGNRIVPLEEKDIYKFIKYRNPFNHPTVMINKKKLLEVGGYQPTDRLEDYNLWVQFVKNNYHVENLNKVLVHMRVNSGIYKRRGGFKYLMNYVRMKNKWRRQGIGDYKTVLFSDMLMTMNVAVPQGVRKVLYRKILHNKRL